MVVAVEDEPSPRRRGLRLLLIALLLLVGVLVLLAVLRPSHGAYPSWTQAVVHVLWLLACLALGVGGFHTVVGAPDTGALRLFRVPVGIVFGIATVGTLAIGGFVLHAAMSYDGPRDDSGGSHEHEHWDWD